MGRRSVVVALALALSLTAGCAGERTGAERAPRPSSGDRAVDAYRAPRIVGRLQVPELTELSGLAASVSNPGRLWAHNDSGGDPSLYCITRSGASCGAWDVTGAAAVDWEDIASGPAPTGDALYIADIGDNGRNRDSVTIYRIREPRIDAGSSGTVAAEAFVMTYADRAHDAEAVIVERTSGDLYVVTKEYARRARVYVARAPFGPTTTLEPVATIDLAGPFATVTGASVSRDGDRVILSTYGKGYELRRVPGRPFESIWDARPVEIDLGSHAQGEAVTYLRSGTIISGSEGAGTPLYAVEYLARP